MRFRPRTAPFLRSLSRGMRVALLAATACVHASATETTAANPRFTGTPLLRSWQAEDYDAAPVNWQVVQHPRTGFIYVANNYGLLEFDGSTWRLHEMPRGGPVRSLAIDADGDIWAGGLGEIALFRCRDSRLSAALDLTAQLPATARPFGNVTGATASPDGICFTSGRQAMLFRDATTPPRVWNFPANVTGVWWQSGSLHLALATGVLLQQRQGEFADVAPAVGAPGSLVIFARRTETDGSTLFLTNLGTRRWPGPGQPLASEADSADDRDFSRDEAVAAAFLPDGRRLYGFLRTGLRVFSGSGRALSVLDEAHGVATNRIEDIFADAEGGAWIAQRTGLLRLQFDSRYAVHGRAQGLDGSPRVLLRHFDRLYVAHNEGVDWRDETTGRFQPVPGLRASVSTFTRAEGRLFGVGASLYEIFPDQHWSYALRSSQLTIVPVPDQPGTFVAGNSTGVSLLRIEAGAWQNLGALSAVPEGVTRFREGGDGTLWGVAYNGSGIWRFDFRHPAALTTPARRFTSDDGLPHTARRDSPRLARLGPDLFVTGATGTRRFDAASGRFVPELGIENFSADTGAVALTAESDPSWWLTAPPRETLGRLVRGTAQPWRFEPVDSGALQGLVPNSLYFDAPANTLWIAAQGALLSADLAWKPAAPRRPLQVFFRGLTPTGSTAPADLQTPLPPSQRSLRIEFAAPTFDGNLSGKSRTLYRSRLDGVDDEWTAWSEAPFREFTALPYRRHVFHVQARALDGRESADATLAFAIAPPWWRSTPMAALYALLAAASLVALFRWRTHALRQRNLQLETVVAARTAELARLRQIDRDESAAAKLAEEKARLETLRYQLNPHFLFNALNSIRALTFKQPFAAGQMIQQLADFCRLTLSRSEDRVPLADEFGMLQLYLEMEKTRWGDLLEVEISATDDARPQPLPPFLLLPLVENALKHGRAASADTLRLRLHAHCEPSNALVIEIANSGVWLEPGTSSAPSSGIGLENLRQRLQRYYPGQHTFTFDHSDGWVRAILRLPRSPDHSAL